MNKFDQVVLGALDVAQSEALKNKNTELHPEHLLLGLILNKSSYVSKAMKENQAEIEGLIAKLPRTTGQVNIESIRPSSKLSEWLTLASSEAVREGKQEVAEKHLLLFLPQIIPNLKVDYQKFSEPAEEDMEVPSFLINLNEMASSGKLDPVIGRSKEIRSVIEILGRRNKNNPVLVGPAGVGKTAIVEGLAEKIIRDEVPDVLKGKTVYSLEMGSLMAGTKYRGDFEERIQNLLKFVKSQSGQVVLFIDEIHQLVGAGRTDGAMDAANLLKPALARGELHCIGATTSDEYQKYILNDPALERRFRSVPVNEPSREDSVEILMGVRQKMEAHHGIKISDDAIYNAVFLSDQYITDKNLPDKAIDLLDEASSALKLSAEAMPASLVELQAELRTKKILAQMEKDEELETEIGILEKEFQEGKSAWEKEVSSLKKVSEIKNRLDRLQFELESAERNQNYEEASKIKYMMIPSTQKELESFEHDWILGRKHIAEVIARQTGIPVEKILKSKQDSILHLESFLNNRVFGQEEAIHEISETLLASYAGLSDESRPMGSFLLLGPTGVGKTETAKALTQYLFDNEENMIRLDLSEFSEKHSVAKLIGAPAGYVGYEEGGVLTEAVRRKPYSVILFDEIEKAHPDFADILLQILDDGRLTDNKGRTINFKNTIIMMTSNSKDPKADFKPEVLGRVDAVLNYHPLNKGVMKELVDKQVKLLNERLRSKKVHLSLDSSAYETLENQGFDFKYGARPLNSVFQRVVTRPLSKLILEGNLSEGELVMKWNGQQMEIVPKHMENAQHPH
ncbi:MAG TPA: AAA family ATPase [Bacteriovoracaceae bacterium]|nr:AAA family ATPase [Bacteriovoracaceae bacterium]